MKFYVQEEEKVVAEIMRINIIFSFNKIDCVVEKANDNICFPLPVNDLQLFLFLSQCQLYFGNVL